MEVGSCRIPAHAHGADGLAGEYYLTFLHIFFGEVSVDGEEHSFARDAMLNDNVETEALVTEDTVHPSTPYGSYGRAKGELQIYSWMVRREFSSVDIVSAKVPC